jgi:hypothetical protein
MALMTRKFEQGDLVYNRDMKEDGAVRRVYEANGITMYEMAVPKYGDWCAAWFYISDWSDDVLQLSGNEFLKSLTSERILCY